MYLFATYWEDVFTSNNPTNKYRQSRKALYILGAMLFIVAVIYAPLFHSVNDCPLKVYTGEYLSYFYIDLILLLDYTRIFSLSYMSSKTLSLSLSSSPLSTSQQHDTITTNNVSGGGVSGGGGTMSNSLLSPYSLLSDSISEYKSELSLHEENGNKGNNGNDDDDIKGFSSYRSTLWQSPLKYSSSFFLISLSLFLAFILDLSQVIYGVLHHEAIADRAGFTPIILTFVITFPSMLILSIMWKR